MSSYDAGRCRREITAAYESTRYKPSDSDMLIADAMDRLAADVEAVKEALCGNRITAEETKKIQSEMEWVNQHEQWRREERDAARLERDAAIRERDQWREEARLAVINRDEARAEVERLRAEVERLRMQLAACGVMADCNTTDSLERNRRVHLDYDCAAVQSVIRAVGREIALRAEVERLNVELAARQPAGNSPKTSDSSPAAPQPAGQGISPKVADTQPTGNAAPAAGWLTDRERHVLSSMLSERPVDSSLHWRDDVQPVFRSILSRAGSPPVVVLPTVFARSLLGDELVALQQVKDAMNKAGVKWKEVPRG